MKYVTVVLCGVVACGGGDHVGHLPDASPAQLRVEPADLSVQIIDNAVVTQPYTAHLTGAHGEDIDVTQETVFSLHDPGYGSFAGATLTVTGQGAGPTRVGPAPWPVIDSVAPAKLP